MASSTQSCENSLRNSPDETIAERLTASFTPREYQIELLDAAKDHNTIACLGTGTGKTFIAVMLIRELAAEVRVLFDEGGKRIIFLVPTVPLVNQQKQVLEEHTDLKIAGYYGEMQADTWDLARWHEEFRQHEVLVMTAEICRIILHHAFLKVSQIKLLIFDECHRAQGCHPYREIMRCFEQCPAEDMPRVFGLSASLLNQKINPSSLEKKICELEKTLRSTVETASDLTDVQKYGTDPKQYLVLYNVHVIQNFAELSEYLSKSLEHIGNGCYYAEENSEIQFFSAPKNCVKQVLNALDNLSVWCAYYVAKLYLKEIKCLLKNLQNKNNNDILTSAQSILENFKHMCDRNFSSLIHSQKTVDLSPKLRRLLEVFVEIKNGQWFFGEENKKLESSQRGLPSNYSSETNNVQSAPICGIVFVEQRITAYILCHWLTDVVKNNPDLEFLVPGFVVGHGINQKLGANETSMSFKKQTQVISDFREKKLNMLFATSVIEEGVDVPKCNVVIRFDLPKDFRSYVQSKGRARAQNSIYVMLASSDELSFVKESLNNYLLIEKLLIERCHNRVMPSEEEIHEHIDDSLLPPYMPVKKDGAPRITLTSAIGLVNRYCAKLPCDKATRLFPRWKIIPLVDTLTKCVQYVCHMNLPINSSVRETIVGEKMSKKRTAKMAAALKACELLHQAGELDDNFICHSTLLDNILNELIGSLDLEETSNNGLQPGTKQYRRVYNKGIADAFKDTLPLHGVSCYLYVLEMELTEPLPEKLNRRRRPIVDPSNTSLGFGILSKKQIPKVCAFPIFTRSGKVVVSIKYVNSCLHCEEEMGKLSEFHRFLFSRSLFLENTVEYCPSKAIFSIYIVPVNKDEGSTYHIDWDFIDYTKKHQFNSEICKPKNEITRLKFKKDLFMDCVVTRSYMIDSLNEKAPIFHFVNQIEYELSPCSCLTSQYGSYKNYYKMKYDLDIQFDSQPLLDTERINSMTLWKPIYVNRKQIVDTNTLKISKSKRKSIDFREHLIPELCIIHPFPATLFRKAINIPTILFRLNALLKAEQLRKNVTTSMSLGEPDLQDELNWPVFDFEKSNEDLKNALNCHVQYQKNATSQDITKSFRNGVNDIISFEVHHDNYRVGPNPGIILQALTPKSAGDEFNLERLETIGDSFLKYSMSVKIYTSYSDFDEGKLTKLRSGIVRNLNLYKLGKNKLLPEFLVCEPFNGKSNWLPPCYILDSDIEMKLAQKRCNKKHKAEDIDFMYLFTKQVISDKCVADSVEALIGAYLLHCGHLGALNFMYWMGLNAFPTVSEEDNAQKSNYRVWPPIPRSPVFEDASSAFHKLCMLTSGMERFENIINYHFKNKAYLLQAFTHPSYTYNDITDCFQRLEFLGDAVLDFLITRKLYDDPKQHTPGDLTDLRAALVNNTYFAALAIKYQYNKFIKMLSPKLFILIEAYIELMKSSEAFQTFELYGYFLEEVECFDIEEIEVPKVLGDVFESVAGAIYLDSGMSLDAVWKIYYPLMKPAIDHMSEYVPKVPVRKLLEMLPSEKPFGNPVVSGDKVTVQVKLPSGTVVCGVGPNKNVAKRSAAKRAISVLKRENLLKF